MTPDPAFEHIHEPGGFRRNYVLLQGPVGEESEPPRILNNFIDFLYLFGHFVSGPLYLGVLLINIHQAGEDLEEIEEEDEEELPDEAERLLGQPSGSEDTSALQAGSEAAQNSLARILHQSRQPKSAVTETSPLLPRSSSLQRSRIRRRRGSVSHGDATVGQAVLMVRHNFATIAHWVACPLFFV
jgi:proton-coupled amino acid transporter